MDYYTRVNNRYSTNNFKNNPKNDDPIDVLLHKSIKDVYPQLSVVMPIHNQEDRIITTLSSVINNTIDCNYELILILDSCSDNTETVVLQLVQNIISEWITDIIILKSKNPLFETAADNLGFICSRGDHILEIQADIEIIDKGYNTKLHIPFKIRDDVIGVSGRCCHGLTYSHGVGKLGYDIELPLSELIDKNVFYISETCNRGPLMLDRNKLKMLGYLDEVNYFLDNSDHDLFARAYYEHKFICGYVPIEFNAPLMFGSTRKPRDPLNQRIFEQKKKTCKENGFLATFLNMKLPSRSILRVSLYSE